VREAHPQIERLGVRVIAVGTGAAYQARHLMSTGTPFPCLVDPDARLYAALGLGRIDWWEWLRPSVWQNYGRAIRRGTRPGRITGDPQRLSGVAFIETERRVRWLYRSRVPGDYPPIATVLGVLRQAADTRCLRKG
jgi:alkyl-hydroperoxide reductase/thiol specific antioxidant family protein